MTTLVTLVIGSTAVERENAIAAAIAGMAVSASDTALILEGLPSGAAPLDAIAGLEIARIAPGCLCCVGNLTMRVTLNRLLRRSFRRLYIGLANSEHLERIRDFLVQSPYDNLLHLTEDLRV